MHADNKAVALNFLKLVAHGNVDEGYEKYVDMDGKHHNVYFSAGFQQLKDAMKESHAKEPNKEFTPRTVICDGDLVAVHSHLKRSSDAPEIQVVHIFRFVDGKIVEMWDCGQEIPKNNPNTDGAF
ncbi:polyketide cyclase [Candidatus Peregrinibacteria bacterium CG10_big_fil_rev_8_21_14_0_10_49_24]|nr:MAG: polyketide cyclase [Candidatus Peregrinibacteria bacterium CG11_big_fil_rev_8_21_14_0_20_49_14]PIR50919.1 MAG: polyketide cyclase [Candidatus Peregrinibacteria bacterium CG10_big_fil_rev_8_21_14_0_10_49_24]PJA67344.1 MAG: polyketide cyclase [Candidatus Peregrinibacteria bacterium CG_4_9_14_3_um_filter_49_12]